MLKGIFPLLSTMTMLSLAGCAAKVLVKSDPPESTVSFVVPDTHERKALGVTPLEITSKKIDELTRLSPGQSSFLEIVVEKEGFQPQSILVPYNRMFGRITELNMRLLVREKEGAKYHELVQDLVNAQTFINDGQFERAEAEARRALKIDGDFIFAQLLLGHTFFLRHNYEQSLQCYELALEIEPGNREAQRMITEARRASGRLPLKPALAPLAPSDDSKTDAKSTDAAATASPVSIDTPPPEPTVVPVVSAARKPAQVAKRPTRLPARKERKQ
jgi:tetratricopeptide (TPR) repeat protein